MADMRLIDANALIKDLRLMAKFQDLYKCSTILGVCSTIEARKTIDAVPVVRCRECNNTKWWPTPKDTIFCGKWGEWMPCNGFCHMGARKDGGDPHA